MKLFRHLTELPAGFRAGAVAIGNFDGVHLGHARIVERLIAQARDVGGPAVVFTFDPHPARLLRPEQAPLPLTWTKRKSQLLGELGVDVMIAYPTDLTLLQLTDREFFELIVRKRLAAGAVVEGPNFFFGHNRTGNVEVLRRLTDETGLELEVVEPVTMDGEVVSSSRIRALLSAGKVDDARQMLTRPYRIRGMVTHGAGRGAAIGFPTANLAAIDTLLPAPGVYAGAAYVNGGRWPAAINIGGNPTFGEQQLKIEVHLLDFDAPLYGEPVEVEFLSRLRDVRQFAGIDDLKRQLARDVEAAREVGQQETNWDER
ncbi:MAG TPA: bifunctional riboflavin kinase/FAD synthetase [Pirellulales bacterium]|nr:bifunctional riboflavin kinase/FAD synthetase [Pirellulales bacterium]